MANIGGRYSWVNDKFGNVTFDPPKQIQYQELCSINTIKDNPKLFENTLSQTDIISKGFYQSEAQKALKNSQIEKAFEIAKQYIKISERKFYRFFDTETKKVIISKQLSRFDAGYVSSAKQKLRGLQKIGSGHDLLHITLTISHTGIRIILKNTSCLRANFTILFAFSDGW